MTLVSDTNILSSFAAAQALARLAQLFPRSTLSMPPAVHNELQAGRDRGRAYLEPLLATIESGELAVLTLHADEQALTATLPQKLNAGEREAIVLCQQRRLPLLSNDRRAIRYCEANGITALDLPTLLRMLWIRGHVLRAEVEQMIARMEHVERLNLSAQQRAAIFAPQRR